MDGDGENYGAVRLGSGGASLRKKKTFKRGEIGNLWNQKSAERRQAGFTGVESGRPDIYYISLYITSQNTYCATLDISPEDECSCVFQARFFIPDREVGSFPGCAAGYLYVCWRV